MRGVYVESWKSENILYLPCKRIRITIYEETTSVFGGNHSALKKVTVYVKNKSSNQIQRVNARKCGDNIAYLNLRKQDGNECEGDNNCGYFC